MSEPEPYAFEDLLGEFGRDWGIVPDVQYADGPQIEATARWTDAPDIKIARRTVPGLRDALREFSLSESARAAGWD